MKKSKAGPDRFLRLIASREALLELAKGVNYGTLTVGDLVLTDQGERHPESATIRKWLLKRQAEKYEFDVLMWWADWVLQEWELAPRISVADHRRRFARVAELCRDLRQALEHTGADFAGGSGAGLRDATLIGLIPYEHVDALFKAATNGEGWVDADFVGLQIATLLERLELVATRFAEEGPIHSQPNKRGAERGYFVRRMGELFLGRYGEQPHEVIAALTTIALGEATDRELVAKLLASRAQ